MLAGEMEIDESYSAKHPLGLKGTQREKRLWSGGLPCFWTIKARR